MSTTKTTVSNVTWYRSLIRSRNVIALIMILCLFVPELKSNVADGRFDDAVRWILSPSRDAIQYDYVMTAKVRLLLFWVGADDVGGGFIRRSTSASEPKIRQLQVLFGSDPAKAPRHINHWGAATEAVNGNSSAFLGFMKSTKADSASDAEAESRKQQTDQDSHAFEAILSVVQDGEALSRRAPLLFDTDFNLHQLEQAQGLAIQRLKDDLRPRQLAGPELQCGSSRGFLQAVDELIGQALNNTSAAPRSLCYTYNARNYTLRLDERSRVGSKTIKVQRKNNTKLEQTYRDLVDARFSVLNQTTREMTYFELLLGTSGNLRGVPVQIIHQPNWWFQVVLNLDPK